MGNPAIKRLGPRDINYLHGVLRDVGMWIRDGRSYPGAFSTTLWAETPRKDAPQAPRATPRPRMLNSEGKPMKTLYRPTPGQPHGTREASRGLPSLQSDALVERAYAQILTLPDRPQLVFTCLYILGMQFQDASRRLDMPSNKIFNNRRLVIESVHEIL